MALIKCSECGKEISDEAEACPHCGKKQAKSGLGCGSGCLVLIAGLVFLSYIGSSSKESKSQATKPASSQSSTSDSDSDKIVSLNAGIRSSGSEVWIVNNDKFSWTGVTIYLNDLHVFSSNFTYKIGRVRPGQTYDIPLMEFTTGDGTRFNPLATKLQKIIITCKTPKGDGNGSWGLTTDND